MSYTSPGTPVASIGTWLPPGGNPQYPAGLTALECVFMAASQTFPMTPASGTLPWQGNPANGYGGATLPWMPNGDGKVLSGLYLWRFRFWTATAPGAGGIKLLVSANNISGLTVTKGFNVDDLTAFTSFRETWLVPTSIGPTDFTNPVTISYSLSAADATGVLRYDMGVTRLK